MSNGGTRGPHPSIPRPGLGGIGRRGPQGGPHPALRGRRGAFLPRRLHYKATEAAESSVFLSHVAKEQGKKGPPFGVFSF